MCAFDGAIKLEGGLIVVLKPDRRAEVDAEIEAIVGRKEQWGANWHHARRDFLAVDFQDHIERTGRLALDVGSLDFDLHLASRQFVFGFNVRALDLEEIVLIRQHTIFDVQGEAARKTAKRIKYAIGIGRHVDVHTDEIILVAKRWGDCFRHPRDCAREGPRCVWGYLPQFRMEHGYP